MEVHSGHGGGVIHGLPGPGLHDGAPPSELIYPRRPALPVMPPAVLTLSHFHFQSCNVQVPGVERDSPCYPSQGRRSGPD